MTHVQITKAVTGWLFIFLGLLLFAALTNIVDASSVFGWIIPLLLIFGGAVLLQADAKYKNGVSYSLIAVGVVMLLVQLKLIHGDLVNGLLGIILLAAGVTVLNRGGTQKKRRK